MISQGFADVTRGIEVDRAAFARDMRDLPPAERCYVVLFTPRSGSSWITSLLSGKLGWPHEFLNPGFVRETAVAMDATTPAGVLQMLLRRRCTPNGVFGMEARFIDIHALDADAFATVFAGRAVFFNLWRQNIVAQGISLYRASATQRFHSDATQGAIAPPDYDADEIRLAIGQVAQVENDNVRFLRKLGVATRFLRYEDMVQDRTATIRLFCDAMGIAFDAADYEDGRAGELVRIGDQWNSEAEARFRAAHAADVAALDSNRLVLRGMTGSAPCPAPVEPLLHAAWQAGHERARAGGDPYANPHAAFKAAHHAWLTGWRSGWDDHSYLAATGKPAVPAGKVLREARDLVLRDVSHPLPQPLHDYTAVRLAEVLHDQKRRGVPGALVEIGLSRGRQTATLLEAARASGVRLVGLDPGGAGMQYALAFFLRRRMEMGEHEWTGASLDLDSASVAEVEALIGGPARFIGIDCSHRPAQVKQALALAEALVGPEGCVAVSDFMQPQALTLTEGVFGYFAQARGLAPFALLPGRLLLAQSAAAARYAELVLALAIRDREEPISARFIDSLAKDAGAALNQTLFGSRIIVLS